MDNILKILRETVYTTDINTQRDYMEERRKRGYHSSQMEEYLEASLATNVPAHPLTDAFQQAYNYTDIVYLAIQHLMTAMSGVSVGLEREARKEGSEHIAQGGAQFTDQGYEPMMNHQLCDILQRPNPVDTFVDFVCQCILNYNLHGRILIWGRPNRVGAPIRFYCLPVPLTVPAFGVGSNAYPFGAWRIQHYYPSSGMMGFMPPGLMGSEGAIIDAREVYEMKNPHPIYRWAPYSHLTGGDNAIDIKQNIDLSFWSIMSQGPKPSGIIDLPGADEADIKQVQQKIDNNHGGARKHGKPIVLGGGDVERPAIKWTPLTAMSAADALHSNGWEIYTSFVLAIFGLDMAGVGLKRSGGYAERWAARRDERDTLMTFLSRLSSTLTNGGLVKQWGLLKKGVRVIINLPELVGYEPSEMSRDMASDGSGTLDEVRYLRGLKAAKKYGNLPVPIALKMIEKDMGVNEQPQEPGVPGSPGEAPPKGNIPVEEGNTPEEDRPDTPKAAEGSLGGEGSGAPRVTKAVIEPRVTKAMIDDALRKPVLILNGDGHDH